MNIHDVRAKVDILNKDEDALTLRLCMYQISGPASFVEY